jgi:hypothetical protein
MKIVRVRCSLTTFPAAHSPSGLKGRSIDLSPSGSGSVLLSLSAALKAELQAGKMKTVKPFSKTCYSENLVLDSSPVADKESEKMGV